MSLKPAAYRALYAAFDQFPGAKGAATHIGKMASALFEYSGGGFLYTLGGSRYLPYEEELPLAIERFQSSSPNYLHRADAYASGLALRMDQMPMLELVHFRDIWSGLASLRSTRPYKTIFEVNGLPSIELPYRYPNLGAKTLAKIRELELFCLDRSDRIIVPSMVIKSNLVKLGTNQDKIDLVPNGAEVEPEFAPVLLPSDPYIIYFGALQPWQGVDTLLKAVAMLRDLPLKLMIVSSNGKKFIKPYQKLAENLGVQDKIIWRMQLSRPELNSLIKNAKLSIAPLKACSRNIDQGCSPLKIFESLACGTPVIASRLPVVEEILMDRVNARLVEPDRPQNLARIIRFLLESPGVCQQLSLAGKTLIKNQYNWQTIKKKLFNSYNKVGVYGT